MKSGIEHRPFTMPQGDFPRVIVSPVDVLNPNEHIPNSIVRMNTKALWDTGADFCMISQELARSLRLVGQGYASVNQVEGNDVSRKAYLVNLLLPNGIVFSDVVALEDPGLRLMRWILHLLMTGLELRFFPYRTRLTGWWISARIVCDY